MSERPFPSNWADRLREKLAQVAKEHPPRITVTPKGFRNSGPYPVGDKWYLPFGQAEMIFRDEGLLSAERCRACGHKVVAASGDLIQGQWCGGCWNARQEALDHPPAA